MERVEKNRIIEEFRGMKNGKLILLSLVKKESEKLHY